MAVAAALRGAAEAGAKTQLIDLRDYKLTLSTVWIKTPAIPILWGHSASW